MMNPDKVKARAKRWRLRNPRSYKQQKLHRYGLTVERFEEMEKAQNGLCAICGNPTKSGIRLTVDHCHKTGRVRELLCNSCNFGLGGFNDDPELLQKAIDYLKKHNEHINQVAS